MNGSPATSIIDFGVVIVAGRSRVANPPASRANAGRRSDPASSGILDQRQQRDPQRLTAAATAGPAEAANPVGIEPHYGYIALPAAISARIFEARRSRQIEAFDRQLGDLGNGDVVTGRDVIGVEIPR